MTQGQRKVVDLTSVARDPGGKAEARIAEMARGLKAEGRNSVGQIQIVVDGFRHVHYL